MKYPRYELYPEFLIDDYYELRHISRQLDDYLFRIDKMDKGFFKSDKVKKIDQLRNIYNEIKVFDINEIVSIICATCERIEVPNVINEGKFEDSTFRYILNFTYRIYFPSDWEEARRSYLSAERRFYLSEEKRSFLSKLYSVLFESYREKKLIEHEKKFNEIIRKHSCEPVQLFTTTAITLVNYRGLFIEILCREIREEELKNDVLFDIDHRDCICSNMFYNNDIDRSIIKSEFNDPQAPYFLVKICVKYLYKYKIQVREIIHRNPKVTNYTLV